MKLGKNELPPEGTTFDADLTIVDAVTWEPVMGQPEIAEALGVSLATVWKWRERHAEFPEPKGRVAGNPFFDGLEVRAWAERTGRL